MSSNIKSFPILICSVATISVIITKIFYPTDREMIRNSDKIDWSQLSANPSPMSVLEKINRTHLGSKSSIDAIDLSRDDNLDKANYGNLSKDAM
jgi:hypothetical protein